jgi:tetratricopeptide (TPR) repeat protein
MSVPARAQAGDRPAANNQGVRAWEGPLTIPTYKLGPADPNPPFPLVSKKPAYPYTILDDLTNNRVPVPVTYRAIYLENRYLKIIILPQLGGHVYSMFDKINHRQVLYHYRVIKYSMVALRGAWIASGMEFSFPYAHTAITVSPIESRLRHNPDGSATAVIGAVDWVTNMHWEVALTLRPNTARLEEGVTLFNSTPQIHLYYFWTNTGVKVSDDAQYIYPERETMRDDPFGVVQSWPISNGVDRSWWKNDPTHMPIFGRDVRRNFFGMYYHQSNYGVVHVADYHQDPGKKIWTLGNSSEGMMWNNILDDNGDAYGEIQSGRFYTQGEREFMSPRHIDRWTEYWYPVRGLDGGFVKATSQLAINAVYPGANSASPQVKLLVSPVADAEDATIIVKQGPKLLREFHHVDFAPMQTATYTIPVQSVEEAKKNLDVEIQSAQGKTLLSWSAAAPIDGNPNFVPMAGKPLATPIPINAHTPIEQLYLQGVFLQKTLKPLQARKCFDRVLAQDPGYVPALLKEAWYYYGTANFKEADSLIRLASRRETDEPSLEYTAGVIDRAEGKFWLANDALWNSVHYGAAIAPGPTLAASYVELGEIAIRQGKAAQAIDLLKTAVGYNSDDAFALADLAAAERLSGNLQDAQRYSAEAVMKMPLLPYALAEQWQDESATRAKANTASIWTNILNSDPQNYLAVASWYHSIGAWQSSNAVLQAAEQNPSVQDITPMVNYYLASNTRHLGDDRQADEYARKAAVSTVTSVFPNRLEDVSVLRAALSRNPSDAQAHYSLGNFLFAKNRYDEAAALWQEALAEGFKNAVVLRNIGVYQWHVKHNLAMAAEDYSEAIQLSPADFRLYSRLDEIYTEQGETAARIKLFQNAPAAVLNQDTIRARRALLFIEQGKDDSALALFTNHLYNKQEEDDNEFHNMFVVANIEKGKRDLHNGQPKQAEASFRQALLHPPNLRTGSPADPNTAEQMYWIGNTLEAQEKSAEAKSAWQKAADQGKGPASVATVYSALAYRKLGQEQTANQLLQQCVESASKPNARAEDFLTAGVAEQYSNNQDQARKDFQRALRLHPALWQARVAMNRLGQ